MASWTSDWFEFDKEPETALASIPMENRYMASEYLRPAFSPATVRSIAKETYDIVKLTKAEIVVVRGLSGILIASVLGAMYDIPFAVVRKPDEVCHGSDFEMPDIHRRLESWLIVDDFIVSGRTIEQIAEAVKSRYWLITGECKGIVLYKGISDDTKREIKALNKTVPIYRVNNNGK